MITATVIRVDADTLEVAMRAEGGGQIGDAFQQIKRDESFAGMTFDEWEGRVGETVDMRDLLDED